MRTDRSQIPERSKWSINWTDGMKLSKRLFEQTDFTIIDQARDVLALVVDENNFGLIPTQDGQAPVIQLNGNTVNVKNVRGVTRGGMRIELLASLFKDGLFEEFPDAPEVKEDEEMFYDILLQINPYDVTQRHGGLIEETPQRIEYILPAYTLKISETVTLNSGTYFYDKIIVGRLIYKNGYWDRVQNYIPPAYRVDAHPDLHNSAERIVSNANGIYHSSCKILETIANQNADDNLTQLVRPLVHSLANYWADQLPHLRSIRNAGKPSYFFNVSQSALTRMHLFFIGIHNSKKPEELDRYLKIIAPDHLNIPELKKSLKQIAAGEKAYNHLNVQPELSIRVKLLEDLDALFSKIAEQEEIKIGWRIVEQEQKEESKDTSNKPKWK